MEVVDTPDIILESEKKISDDGATPVRDVKAEPSVEATVHDFVEDIKHVKRELRPRLKKSDWPMNAASCSVKMEPPDLDRFLREAKLFEPDILWSTLGAIVFPQVSLWDILVQKMKYDYCTILLLIICLFHNIMCFIDPRTILKIHPR
jgi:hypothetical protein